MRTTNDPFFAVSQVIISVALNPRMQPIIWYALLRGYNSARCNCRGSGMFKFAASIIPCVMFKLRARLVIHCALSTLRLVYH
jgi:hypothetical protein